MSAAATAAPSLRALLKPRMGRPGDTDLVVSAIARTGKGKVTVTAGRNTWSVEAWRLYSATNRSQRLPATDLARLPWNGKGADPLNLPTQEAALRPSSLRAPARGEVPCNQGGGVMSNSTAAHDPSCGAFASRAAPDSDYRDTSPPSAGRRA